MKKVWTISGIVLGSAVGASLAYFMAPEKGKYYQKKLQQLALQTEQKAAETSVKVLDELIDLLDSADEKLADNKEPEEVISIELDPHQ